MTPLYSNGRRFDRPKHLTIKMVEKLKWKAYLSCYHTKYLYTPDLNPETHTTFQLHLRRHHGVQINVCTPTEEGHPAIVTTVAGLRFEQETKT